MILSLDVNTANVVHLTNLTLRLNDSGLCYIIYLFQMNEYDLLKEISKKKLIKIFIKK